MVKCLPTMSKAQGSIPSTAKNKLWVLEEWRERKRLELWVKWTKKTDACAKWLLACGAMRRWGRGRGAWGRGIRVRKLGHSSWRGYWDSGSFLFLFLSYHKMSSFALAHIHCHNILQWWGQATVHWNFFKWTHTNIFSCKLIASGILSHQ